MGRRNTAPYKLIVMGRITEYFYTHREGNCSKVTDYLNNGGGPKVGCLKRGGYDIARVSRIMSEMKRKEVLDSEKPPGAHSLVYRLRTDGLARGLWSG